MVETRAVRRAKALLEGIGKASKTTTEPVLGLEGDFECYSQTYRRRGVQSFPGTSEQISSLMAEQVGFDDDNSPSPSNGLSNSNFDNAAPPLTVEDYNANNALHASDGAGGNFAGEQQSHDGDDNAVQDLNHPLNFKEFDGDGNKNEDSDSGMEDNRGEDSDAEELDGGQSDPEGPNSDEERPELEEEDEDIHSDTERVPMELVLEPRDQYEMIVAHRKTRVNSIQILKRLELFQNGKAQMHIPLCRMRKLQVVRPALENDVAKMQAEFSHGYRDGASVFYVSTTNFQGHEKYVTEAERAKWSAHWRTRDQEFEEFLSRDPELAELSNKFFYVWDGNHRLVAWYEFIRKSHKQDLEWHYMVRSIVLRTAENVTDVLTAMHDINKSNENSHVKQNLVHTLHRMQKVGTLPLEKFKDILTSEEMAAAKKQQEVPLEKRPWYPLSRAKFLDYIYSQDIMEAGDEGQRRYEEETHRRRRTAEGLNAAINGAMEAKRKALTAPFNKFLAIANPANGKNFLPEIAKHWSANIVAEMTTEKLQNLAASCIPPSEKEHLLKLWNSSKSDRKMKKFPISPFNDVVFNNYLHKYVFWHQLKAASLKLYSTIMMDYPTSEKPVPVSLEKYIDYNRIHQWDYAFNIPIMKKQISKSAEWDTPKQPHGEPAMNRLIYRYWKHILLKEGVVTNEHPSFASWLDIQNPDTMFMSDQARDWSQEHLNACHWYIEMDPNETPPHLLELRKQVEPAFQRPAPIQAQGCGRVSGVDMAPGRAATPKVRSGNSVPAKATTVAATGREVGAKKRQATKSPVEDEAPKRGKHSDQDQDLADIVEVSQSEAKSSRSQSHWGGAASVQRTDLIFRAPSGADYYEQIENKAVGTFLGADSATFEEFARKARGNEETYIGGKKGMFPCADLIIIDTPFDSIVSGFGNQVPKWNSMGGKPKEWYSTRFEFASRFLHDDGGILIFMPSGMNYEIMRLSIEHRLRTKCEWSCHQSEPLTHPLYDDMMTYMFSALLLLKTGRAQGKPNWERLPKPLKLNSDPLLANTPEDPLRFLSLRNDVQTPTLGVDQKSLRGPHEKSDVFFQTLIDMCSKEGDIVVDLSASTGASLRACRASGRHFFGIEEDLNIFQAVLLPMAKQTESPKSRNGRGMDAELLSP
ncbi:hypothetical protein M758_1G295400 [Ceratodon purpureus]|nr:hypothetical protein M758_1G295400 [Ceratodon purpureus]